MKKKFQPETHFSSE